MTLAPKMAASAAIPLLSLGAARRLTQAAEIGQPEMVLGGPEFAG